MNPQTHAAVVMTMPQAHESSLMSVCVPIMPVVREVRMPDMHAPVHFDREPEFVHFGDDRPAQKRGKNTPV